MTEPPEGGTPTEDDKWDAEPSSVQRVQSEHYDGSRWVDGTPWLEYKYEFRAALRTDLRG